MFPLLLAASSFSLAWRQSHSCPTRLFSCAREKMNHLQPNINAQFPSPLCIQDFPGISSYSLFVQENFCHGVGHTSLLLLRGLSEKTGCKIYGKAEFENPGGSVKDRAALFIIQEAEQRGDLVPGEECIIVEGTAGNTGIGLTLVGAARGYKTIIVMADNNSIEKQNLLRSLGATVLVVPFCPFKNPNNYVHIAARLKARLDEETKQLGLRRKVFLADQWANPANRRAHFTMTGPEIYSQLQGKLDVFCCATGTGGTFTGITTYLKQQNPNIQCIMLDPRGSCLSRYFQTGELKSEGSSIAEGIGQGRLTGNLTAEGFRPERIMEITDEESLPLLQDLLEYEGVSIGSSSMINIGGAYRIAKELGPGHTIVTILADSGLRYASKLYNPTFLRSKNLPVPRWLDDSNADREARIAQLNAMLKETFVPVPQ